MKTVTLEEVLLLATLEKVCEVLRTTDLNDVDLHHKLVKILEPCRQELLQKDILVEYLAYVIPRLGRRTWKNHSWRSPDEHRAWEITCQT